MSRKMRKLIAMLMCLVLFLSMGTAAFAALETTEAPDNAGQGADSIIDEEALGSQVKEVIDRYTTISSMKASNVSIAYTYLATGDTWFYNPDTWFYSASLYKVPLMMILAEREAKGEINADTMIENISLAEMERVTLVNSNNDSAHAALRYISGKTVKKDSEVATRPLYMAYSDLPETYYHSDFVNYSYFSARFMNDVMNTLYSEPNSFPHIIDYLKQAEPDHYFRYNLGNTYDIAQKYGYYKDSRQTEWHSASGIIYTPNPILLTVMTADAPYAEAFMADLATLFTHYTLELDSQLEAHKQQLALAQAQAEAEAKAAAEAEAQAQAEAQARAEAEAAQRKAEQEQAIKQAEKQEKAEARKEISGKVLKYVGIVGGAILFILLFVKIFSSVRKRREQFEDDAEVNSRFDDGFEGKGKSRFLSRRKKYSDEEEPDDEDLDDDELDDEFEDMEEEAPRYAKAPARKTYYDDAEVNVPDRGDSRDFDERDSNNNAYRDDEEFKSPASKFGGFKGFSGFKRGDDDIEKPERRSERSSGGYVPKH